MFKTKNSLLTDFSSKIFASETESHYTLRRWNGYHGKDSISFLGPKILNVTPTVTKQPTSP